MDQTGFTDLLHSKTPKKSVITAAAAHGQFPARGVCDSRTAERRRHRASHTIEQVKRSPPGSGQKDGASAGRRNFPGQYTRAEEPRRTAMPRGRGHLCPDHNSHGPHCAPENR
ncbi:hypothetical protein GDO81_029820 [Engystomops pustulosus]|uniref:Uncharacterized protein n=1 Tax=Engystomops pustulosus TaxID=76066 RepID=A0AAV6YJ04_ENGPU|nr:hypothetical protein GDO81_029820 [Engystomops pustulosus]